MNDKQKELALKMAVEVCSWATTGNKDAIAECARKGRELLAAFDAAADAPKRKYTVADIEKPKKDDGYSPFYRIRCGEFGWTDIGWLVGGAKGYFKREADMIYAGLVSTGNVPEVGE